MAFYAWRNTDGEVININLDTLPVTNEPANVIIPNLHIGDGTNGTNAGQFYRVETPLFWFAPDGQLHRSTKEPLPNATTNWIHNP